MNTTNRFDRGYGEMFPADPVVIGGLLTATALTLLVLPTFAAKAVKHRKAEGIEE